MRDSLWDFNRFSLGKPCQKRLLSKRQLLMLIDLNINPSPQDGFIVAQYRSFLKPRRSGRSGTSQIVSVEHAKASAALAASCKRPCVQRTITVYRLARNASAVSDAPRPTPEIYLPLTTERGPDWFDCSLRAKARSQELGGWQRKRARPVGAGKHRGSENVIGVSCGGAGAKGWRTELELGCSKSLENPHRAATFGTAPKWIRLLGWRRFWFGLRWLDCVE